MVILHIANNLLGNNKCKIKRNQVKKHPIAKMKYKLKLGRFRTWQDEAIPTTADAVGAL
jgi:hypothetical protein